MRNEQARLPALDASMAALMDEAVRQSGPAQAMDQALRAARREWRLLLLFTTLAAAAAGAYLAAIEPRYMAEAIITVSPRQSDIANTDAITRDGALRLPDTESELQILNSPASLSRIVAQLALARQAEEQAAAGGSGNMGLLQRLSGTVSARLGPPALDLESAGRSSGGRGAAGALVDQLGDAVRVTPIGRSTLARIRVNATDPELSAEVANAVAENYLADRVRGRQDAALRAAHWLRARAEELRASVLEADRRLAALRLNLQENGRDATQVNAEMAGLSDQLIRARVEAERASHRHASALELVRQSGSLAVLERDEATGTDRYVDRLRGSAAEAAQDIARLSVEAGGASPDLRRAQALQRIASAQLEAAARAKLAALDAERAAAAGLVAALEERIQSLRAQANSMSARQVELDAVALEANTNRTVYETFLSRWRTTEQVGFNDTDGWLVSPATVPERSSWPKIPLIAAVALLAGLGFGATAVGIREFHLGRTLRSGGDVARAMGAGTRRLGLVPRIGGGTHGAVRAVLSERSTAYQDSVAALREAVLESLPEPAPGAGGRVVALTSAVPGEGKSLILAGIAAAASAGRRVAVLDCDPRSDGQGPAFAAQGAAGAASVLSGSARSWREAGRLDPESGVFVLPVGRWAARPQEFAHAPGLAALVAEMRREFDLVLLDAPPVLSGHGGRAVCRMADAAVLVVRWGWTPAASARAAADRLAGGGVSLAGMVMAGVDLARYATFDDPAFEGHQDVPGPVQLAAPAGRAA